MQQNKFMWVLNRLFILSDEELQKLDYASAKIVVTQSRDISEFDKKRIIKLFNDIEHEMPLRHHGILGQKWGVRRYQNEDGTLTEEGKKRLKMSNEQKSIFGTSVKYEVKTENGETLKIEPIAPWTTGEKIMNTLTGHPEKYIPGFRGDANYDVKTNAGQKIGEFSLINKKHDTAYIDWITIDDRYRNRGYASAIIKDSLKRAKDAGYSKVELNALKEARPLYEKLGFKYSDDLTLIDRISGFEFGAKRMSYDFNELNHSKNLNQLMQTKISELLRP